MEARKIVFRSLIVLFLAGGLAGIAAPPVFAQVVIPEGSTIDQADFSIFSLNGQGQTVNLYRITADWAENFVTWNSFGSSYDPTVVGSFWATYGLWNTVDATPLVQSWVDGAVPNLGIFLEQGNTMHVRYHSSESDPTDVFYRPKLEIWYTSPAGIPGHVVIQRPGEATEGVSDAYIWESSPTSNFGDTPWLFTGIYAGAQKQSLVRFYFDVEPPQQGPGTGTQGYWKNHPDAWPVDEISIGGHVYPKNEAIRIMKKPTRKDMTKAMFRQLVAAKLNVLIGNDNSCIQPEIDAADIWLTTYPAESGVKANSAAWTEGEPIHEMLDEYNKGHLPCANHRD